MNGYEKRTELKKELILVTAQNMFFSNGVTNTSIIDIAKEANVSKVTIFKYFGTKEGLAREVMRRYIETVTFLGKKILNEQISFYEKLEKLFSIGGKNRNLFRTDVFNKELWEDPFIQQLYSEEAVCIMPFIIDFFEQRKKEGEIDPSIPTEALLAYITAIIPLLNPGKYNPNSSYAFGMHKLFYYGLFGSNSAFDEMIKLKKDSVEQ